MQPDLVISQTQSTPAIEGDRGAGRLFMQGDAYPENAFAVFDPVFNWLQQVLETQTNPFHLELELGYLNTSSVKSMMDIFDLLEEVFAQGREIQVVWRYAPANDRIAEVAEEFREDCTFPFAIEPR